MAAGAHNTHHGPLQVVPNSHRGSLFDPFPGGNWTGYIDDSDLTSLALDSARADGFGGYRVRHLVETSHEVLGCGLCGSAIKP
jgi:hypothetical protein